MKRTFCILFICLFLFSLSACDLRGSTSVLDSYSANDLLNTYEAICAETLKVKYPINETLPKVNTFLVDSKDYFSNVVTFYLYNQSDYFIQVMGYAWLIQPIDNKMNGYKMIYYNLEKKVSNATYKIKIDPASNAYFPFESLDKKIGTPDINAMIFFFFHYEDTDYVGCTNANRDLPFVCWPLSQTLKGEVVSSTE